METLPGGLTLHIPQGCFPLSTDSMVLADFIHTGRQDRILDLGSGCGTLGLLLCARDLRCHVTGIELDPQAHTAALENILCNDLTARMDSICADLKEIAACVPAGSFDCCISNPPYFSGGALSRSLPAARQTLLCSAAHLFAAAQHALRYGGDFYLVHKPEQLATLCHLAVQAGLEPKRLRLVRHREGKAPALVLLQCRKGGKSGLILDELNLYDADGQPTQAYRRIYHL